MTRRPRVTRAILEGALRACEHALNADWEDGDPNQAKIAATREWVEATIAWLDDSLARRPNEHVVGERLERARGRSAVAVAATAARLARERGRS